VFRFAWSVVIGITLFSAGSTIDTIFILLQLHQAMLAVVKNVVRLDLLMRCQNPIHSFQNGWIGFWEFHGGVTQKL
jgi:hypothetical protein